MVSLNSSKEGVLTEFDKYTRLLTGIHGADLKVVLAQSQEQIDQARRLRYRIFFNEMSGNPDDDMIKSQMDGDEYDAVCDHLLVIDTTKEKVVGTYRLLGRAGAAKVGKFYTQNEFIIDPLLESQDGILELGRSCVDREYRSKATIQLLWRAIAAYMNYYEIRYLFGCASFSGVDVEAIAEELSYLHHYHSTPEDISISALPEHYIEMNSLPAESLDVKAIMKRLPALIKGYLRVGCYIGSGAFIDYDCQTTDVCIVLDMEKVPQKYKNFYLGNS